MILTSSRNHTAGNTELIYRISSKLFTHFFDGGIISVDAFIVSTFVFNGVEMDKKSVAKE